MIVFIGLFAFILAVVLNFAAYDGWQHNLTTHSPDPSRLIVAGASGFLYAVFLMLISPVFGAHL